MPLRPQISNLWEKAQVYWTKNLAYKVTIGLYRKLDENETITTLLAYQKPFEKISLLWEDEFEGIVYLSVSFRVDDCEGKTRRLTKDKTMS